MSRGMADSDFDKALITAAFDLAAERGWQRVTVPAAALRAGLPLDEARGAFPGRGAVLMRFGRLADMAALAEAAALLSSDPSESATRDLLFGMIMRRIDVLQAHRAGVIALFRYLPTDPGTALLLASATRRSMAWLLEGAGISSSGLLGALRTKGLMAVWLWTVRAWQRDESADLSATMAALDEALRRAERAESMLPCGRRGSSTAGPDFPGDSVVADTVPTESTPVPSAGMDVEPPMPPPPTPGPPASPPE
jgi:ubiquinone biosynthesis protein COQ9